MKNSFAIIMTVLVAVTLALTGCHRQKTFKIGVSQCSSDDWRRKLNEEIEREAMFHENASIEIRSAGDSNAKQIADIDYFVKKGFDIIIVSPNEAEALTPAIKKVYESGTPVIIFDRNINGKSYTARIGVDDENLGRSAARYARNLAGASANVLEIYGRPGSTPADGRHKGFVEEFTATGGNVLATAAGNWNQDEAEVLADSLLRLYPKVDLIYAHNDRMAIGASEVARRLGRDSIKIIGIDAAPEIGIKAVADGTIDATFLYPTEGHRIIRTALAILEGKPYKREVVLPTASAVDKTNADILLLQNEALKEETGKMRILKHSIDEYWEKHSSQTMLLYAGIVIIVLLFGVVFLTLRAFWQRKKHQSVLEEQNRMLERQRDEQAALNERLEAATRSKLIFFTNVSHDLRTPLTLIAEPVKQLADAPNLTEPQRSLLRIAAKNILRLQRLINQILDFRKMENGKLDMRLTEARLGALIADWGEGFAGLAARRDIKLTVRTDVAEDFSMAVDVEKIERVFFNILSNAFKYTPDNGSITVTCTARGAAFSFTVEDTGRGIPADEQKRIFDRFYQVDKVRPTGSGIGLSLSKAFVELHGGSICVESETGKGTRFTVTLPVKHVEEKADENYSLSPDVMRELGVADDPDDAVFDAAKPVLLVIDDNEDILQLVGTLLSGDYNIVTARNGAEGLKKGTKYVPDLIICDVMMPGIDGLECCRRLKAEMSTSHIPVLLLTACSLDEQRAEGYESGADGYLSKPFDTAVLRARCRSLIENRKRIMDSAPTKPAQRAAAPQPGRKTPGKIDSEFYDRFCKIVEAEMGNPDLNVDALAGRLGLGRSQFYRKIKALTNYSPVELVRKMRLKAARDLLTATERSVSEIAYGVGFSSPAYFSRCFKEAYGESPSELRDRLSPR